MLLRVLLVLTILGVASSDIAFGGTYRFQQTVSLQDKGLSASTYQIRATASVEQVHRELLKVKIDDIKLLTHSKKLPPGIFKVTHSVFESSVNNDFFIEISHGTIKNLFVASSEEPHVINLKRSFSDLLQFETGTHEKLQTDVCGSCHTKYEYKDSFIRKLKLKCQSDYPQLTNDIWGGSIIPHREAIIKLTDNRLQSIKSKEDYTFQLSISDIGETVISTEITLSREIEQKEYTTSLSDEEIKTIIADAGRKFGIEYVVVSLSPDTSQRYSSQEHTTELSSLLKENFNYLTAKELGTVNSAIAALKVMKAIKQMSYIDIYNTLKSKNNKKIRMQLLDILGAVQTLDTHKAAMAFLKINSKDQNLDLCERYLWGLSTSSVHKKAVILDLLSIAKNEISDLKLLDTLMQTISSMIRKSEDEKLLETGVKFISEKLKKCNGTDELCHRIYLKALANIRSPKAIDLLAEHVFSGSKRVGFRAMKALHALSSNERNDKVIKIAEQVFLTNGTYDSSAKVIALDILLESNMPSMYSKLIQLLKHRHASPELKEILLQRLTQLSEKNEETKQLIKSAFINERLNHYHALAQGGLSTAFDRRFMTNGFLSTAQEVKSGLLKQGYVHINLENGGVPKTMFTLGLFSNGLSSFVSDGSDDDDDENEVTNAGLELTVMGVEFRPFIFFEGNGELMGHVFSGSGSTLTPAYQAIVLLKDDETYLPIGTGELVSIRYTTVASVDLSGKIEISLWSRAAESLVQNSAGLLVEEIIEINSPYINARAKVELTAEPQLKLSSDIQFSSKVALCLQLEQSQARVQCNTTHSVAVVGSKFRSKKFINRRIDVPGKTYALNSKNNEMCALMHS